MIKKILLIFIFLSFTFSQIFRIETTFGFGIMAFDLIIIISSWGWFGVALFQKKIHRDIIMNVFLSFFGIGLISLLLNPLHLTQTEQFISGVYIVRYLSFGLLFFVLREEDAMRTFIRQLLLWSGVSILLLGFVQFFLYSSLRNLYYLGWDEHLHRLFTTFLDPNFAGIFFAFFLLFLFYGLFRKLFPLQLLYTLIPLTTLALILTYSRSSYLCAGVSILFLFILEKKTKQLKVFLTGVLVLFVLLLPTFFTHNTDLFRIASSVSRLDSYKEGWSIAFHHPLLGVGFNSYRYAVQAYGYHRNTDILYNHAEAGNDNSFLFVLGTTGIIGLSIYVWFLTLLISRYAVGEGRAYILSSALVLILGSFFNNVLFYTPLLFWFLLTLTTTKNT